MAGFLPPVVATLLGNITDYTAKMDEAAAKAAGTDAKISAAGKASQKLFMGVGLAALGVGVASVKMASDFQTQMTRLYTAAGAPKQAVLDSYNAVLSLGNAVGFTGTQMAEALYHPVSAGLDLATSLQVVKYAAQEAQISGASLDDTTYSLSSVMKAFNLSADQAHSTMATLNSIVGQGDMRFQDFNTSIKNWAPTAAQMGISITSMGAALAYLTDRGNSAEEAATRVTMGLSMMATPSKQAAKLLEGMGVASSDVSAATDSMTNVLKKTGITQNQLAMDLKSPDGIYVALTHLKTALHDAGVSGTEADSVLAKIFGGGRSDKAIMSLLQNLDGLKTKFQDITGGSKAFDQAWADTQKNFSFQMKQLGASAENVGIKIGLAIIPVIQSIISFFQQNGWAATALAVVIGVVLAGAMLRFAQIATTNVLKAIDAVITGFKSMATSAKTSGAETAAAATKTEAASTATGGWASSLGKTLPIIGAATVAIGFLVDGIVSLGKKMDASRQYFGKDIDQVTSSLLDMSRGSRSAFDQVIGNVTALADQSRRMGFTWTDALKNIDSSLGSLVTSGNAKAAKTDFDDIAKRLESVGFKASEVAALFPSYTKAVEDAATQTKVSAAASQEAGGAIGTLPGSMDSTTTSANAMADAINSATDAFNTMAGNITSSDALNAFNKDLLTTTDTLAKNGRSLADNTVAGIDNRDAFNKAAKEILSYRDAQIKNGVSTDQANTTASAQAQQLIKVWEQLGVNKQAVEDYAASLGLIKATVDTTISVDTANAEANIANLQRQLNNISQSTNAGYGGGGRVKAYATGGWVDGPKGAPQLSILHGGEFVLSQDMLNGAGASVPLGGFGLSTSSGTGGGGTTINIIINGSPITTEGELRSMVQTAFLKSGMSNVQNGLTFTSPH